MKSKLGFGCIGIGQCGINLAKHFSKEFPTLVIDTHIGNLRNCKEINKDLKFLANSKNLLGGAGKNPLEGKKIIEMHIKEITELIENNLMECDYIWITASLGGGSGTLGNLVIATVLESLCIPYGLFLTLPNEIIEGKDEIINAYLGLGQIEKMREKLEFLHSIVLIENEKLDKYVMSKMNVGHEERFSRGNKYLFDKFFEIYRYTNKKSDDTFDGKDYLRTIKKKGYMTFGDIVIEDIDKSSENVLVNNIANTLEKSVFIDELDFKTASGIGIIIDRPDSLANDGIAIKNMLRNVKGKMKNASISRGIYKSKTGKLIRKNKPLKMLTVISGLDFPYKRFKKLEAKAQQYKDNKNNKQTSNKKIKLNLDYIEEMLIEEEKNKKRNEYKKSDRKRKSFEIFEDTDKLNKLEEKLKKENI